MATTPAFAWGMGNTAFPYGMGGDDPYATPSTGTGQQLANSAKSFSTVAAPAEVSSNSTSIDDYLKLAQLGLGAYNSFIRKPKFTQVPQTPQEKELMDLYIAGLKNPATANNASIVSSYAQQALQNTHPSWQSPKTFSGQVGYQGNPGFNFQMPNFSGTTTTPPVGNPGPPTGAQPSGIPGAQVPGVPGAGGSDPFFGLGTPGGNAQSMTWDDVKRMAMQFGPTAMKLVTDGSLVGLGISGAVNFIRSHFGGGTPPDQLPGSNQKYPGDILTPGGGYKPPDNNNIFNPDYYKQQGDKQLDNNQAGTAIGGLLGLQQGGGGDRKGFKAF